MAKLKVYVGVAICALAAVLYLSFMFFRFNNQDMTEVRAFNYQGWKVLVSVLLFLVGGGLIALGLEENAE